LSHPPSQSANASGAAAAAPQSANASGAAAAQGEEQEQLPYPLQDPQDSASCLNAGKKGVFKMLHWVKEQIKGLWWAFFWLFETDPLKPGAPPAVWEALHVQREARQLREAGEWDAHASFLFLFLPFVIQSVAHKCCEHATSYMNL
jgi:hypothetical protein